MKISKVFISFFFSVLIFLSSTGVYAFSHNCCCNADIQHSVFPQKEQSCCKKKESGQKVKKCCSVSSLKEKSSDKKKCCDTKFKFFHIDQEFTQVDNFETKANLFDLTAILDLCNAISLPSYFNFYDFLLKSFKNQFQSKTIILKTGIERLLSFQLLLC
jgi:hypothetical protein